MNTKIIKIGIFILLISIIIYIVKNFKDIRNFFEKNKEKKLIKIIKIVLIIIFIIFICITFYKKIIQIKFNIDWYKQSILNDKMNLKYDNMIIKEMNFYEKAISKEYEKQNPQNPYIPENFEYVEGEWNTGFVIQDESKNQYVWVPCTNKDNNGIEKLQRTNYSKTPLISKDICANEKYEKFTESSLENGGFYISRFEIGNENNIPVSKMGVEIYNGVNIEKATEIVDSMYDNENVNCEIINGYAYDTTLNWIINTNNIEIDIVDIKNGEKAYSGRKKYNNIYDFIDNTMDITLENSYDNVILRGFPYQIDNKVEDIRIKNEILEEMLDRFSIFKDKNYFSNNSTLSFRTVLYK